MTSDDSTTVRPAASDDLDAVVELWAELVDYHQEIDPRFWERSPEGKRIYRGWAQETIEDEERLLLVAEVAGEIVGYSHAYLRESPPPMVDRTAGLIADLAVTERFKRRGIGRLLAEATLEWFDEKGTDGAMLSAAVLNDEACGFWRAVGFEPLFYNMIRRP